jgi:hypothetical protein
VSSRGDSAQSRKSSVKSVAIGAMSIYTPKLNNLRNQSSLSIHSNNNNLYNNFKTQED